MPDANEKALARISEESAAHILRAHASCERTTGQLLASRDAVGRSLDLLAQTSCPDEIRP